MPSLFDFCGLLPNCPSLVSDHKCGVPLTDGLSVNMRIAALRVPAARKNAQATGHTNGVLFSGPTDQSSSCTERKLLL